MQNRRNAFLAAMALSALGTATAYAAEESRSGISGDVRAADAAIVRESKVAGAAVKEARNRSARRQGRWATRSPVRVSGPPIRSRRPRSKSARRPGRRLNSNDRAGSAAGAVNAYRRPGECLRDVPGGGRGIGRGRTLHRPGAAALRIANSTLCVTMQGRDPSRRAEIDAWVERSARIVAQYYGRFPAPVVTIDIDTVPGDGVGSGRTTNESGLEIRVQVGTMCRGSIEPRLGAGARDGASGASRDRGHA